jgi:hypothetical protein
MGNNYALGFNSDLIKNKKLLKKIRKNIWWRYRDLNPGPIDYDSTALTN